VVVVAVRWLAAALQWLEPKAASDGTSAASSVKLYCCSNLLIVMYLIGGCHGDGDVSTRGIWQHLHMSRAKTVLHEFLGDHSCIALAPHGRRATLLNHILLVVPPPPSMMPLQRAFSCSVLALLGILVPSDSSPTAAVLTRISSGEIYCTGKVSD
jgi:hypothetical protein